MGIKMSRGKHLSLEEARKENKFKQFAREHPTKGDKKRFDRLLDRMAKGKGTSKKTK